MHGTELLFCPYNCHTYRQTCLNSGTSNDKNHRTLHYTDFFWSIYDMHYLGFKYI